jgi:hypothetical protein
MNDELEPGLRQAIREEAFRAPLTLTGRELLERLASEDRRRRARRSWYGAAVAAAMVLVLGSLVATAPRTDVGPRATAPCPVSPATRHGSWWVEIGGPNAFFNVEPGSLWANDDGSTWLIHVRFNPDADAGAVVSMHATGVGTDQRFDAALNSRADPHSIFRFGEAAPDLPGGWYLFEQRFPSEGCWELTASINGEPAGSATISVGAAPMATNAQSAVPSADAPTPELGVGLVTARYPDGLPARMGDVPVRRGSEALDFAATRSDAQPFLVTGWVTYWGGPTSCPLQIGDVSWARDCQRARFADRAGGSSGAISDAITFRYVLDQVHTGPVVAEVHVHDPRAVSCRTAEPACDAMMVVDRIVWEGDAATAAAPLDAPQVARVLSTVQGSRDMAPIGDGPLYDCGQLLPAAAAYNVVSGLDKLPGVTLVQILPDAEAVGRALPGLSGVDAALLPTAVECTVFSQGPEASASATYRWLLVENVALLVRTHVDPSAHDRTFLERLDSLLREAASGD